jgi:hypothetical protein
MKICKKVLVMTEILLGVWSAEQSANGVCMMKKKRGEGGTNNNKEAIMEMQIAYIVDHIGTVAGVTMWGVFFNLLTLIIVFIIAIRQSKKL